MANKIWKAREGMILTDGKNNYGKLIDLAEGVDAGTFYEITREEYESRMASENEETI